MLKRIKNMFGIDGVKLSISAPEKLLLNGDPLNFVINVSSKSDLVLDTVSIKLIEKYKRGWGESKLIDEYVLYEKVEELDMLIDSEQPLSAPLKLNFNYAKSDIEKLGEKAYLKPLVKLAMIAKRVKSTFRLEVTAKVKGVRMNPLAVHHFTKSGF